MLTFCRALSIGGFTLIVYYVNLPFAATSVLCVCSDTGGTKAKQRQNRFHNVLEMKTPFVIRYKYNNVVEGPIKQFISVQLTLFLWGESCLKLKLYCVEELSNLLKSTWFTVKCTFCMSYLLLCCARVKDVTFHCGWKWHFPSLCKILFLFL